MRIDLHDPFIAVGMVVGITVAAIQFLLPEWLFWCLTVASLGLCTISIRMGNRWAIVTLVVLAVMLIGVHLRWVPIPDGKNR
jgi:hypothetical protein